MAATITWIERREHTTDPDIEWARKKFDQFDALFLKAKRAAAKAKYDRSPKGKARRARFDRSPKGKAHRAEREVLP